MSSENTQPVNAQCPKCFTLCNEKDVDYESKHCKACRPKTVAERLAEELEKFENGAQRYETSDAFKVALNSLSHGLGVYAVLDNSLRKIEMLHRVNKALSVMELHNKTLKEQSQALQAANIMLIEKLKKYETL